MSSPKHATILILDFGSQYTQLIARRVRELGLYSVVYAGDAPLSKIEALSPRAIVFSGGPKSVDEPGAPLPAQGFFEYQARTGVPVLGVCYGLQLFAKFLGGKVTHALKREYGRMEVLPEKGCPFFTKPNQAWMSHGDEVETLPTGFELKARSAGGAIAVIENTARKMIGIQFHPEVTHTEHGVEFLKWFFVDYAKVKPDWTMASVLQEQIEKIRAQVGPTEHVICALSGGVDSAVAAKLVHQAVGDRLHCVFVDTGLLRFQEAIRVMKMFKEELHLPVKCVDAGSRFLGDLKGIEDPEKKRKIIGGLFIKIFDEEAHALADSLGHTPRFLVQGTLYPDVIESAPREGEKKHATTIKSHHNVGGLPKDLRFELIEPLRDLFKDEVRALGRELKVPENFIKRHPFPGPGLGVRIVGDITPERVDILQKVDEIFISMLREHGLYDKIWQAFAVFLPIRSVGVMGDGRTHDHVVGLRAVTSSDGMTADWYPFEPKFLGLVSSRICNEVKGVNRVVYDISSKPPATIEWE